MVRSDTPNADTPNGDHSNVRSAEGHGTEECTREQSLDLLSQTVIGRLIHTDDAMPAVTPSCFTLDGLGEVVIPLPASWRAELMDGEVVGFQADRFDEQTLQGWTVLIVGRSRLVTDPVTIADLDHRGPLQWGHRPTRGYLSIQSELVTGRRFGS
ncbi:pyridoxamine 5'-phosphate oxidase family protein [Kitasatospora sp. NBC_00240]|uniref:pyridoxamine 5'-phosphate oxidase family protein n=1 Tax=Kitasatospora sp. NBC_00240 TaxID=2903567 RepID=UPI002256E4A2|nr:pyridoxamine 5'-phosphate oxidase family protein [Kitasatospora sp. NBC_00240]MCX5208235.1 pyridoxamine 5'-phosphate oxidase family protein [Kitasatospora sp. NBC_00240]